MSVLINELEIVPPPADDAPRQQPQPAAPAAAAAGEEPLTAAGVAELLERRDERCLRIWAH
jgi:hypothetical protein